MSKKKILIILSIVLIISVGGFFGYQWLTGKSSTNDKDNVETTGKVAEREDEVKSNNKVPTEQEALKIAIDTYDRFLDYLYSDELYGTDDRSRLEDALTHYVTDNFLSFLRQISLGDIYCECDLLVFEHPEFNVRNKIIDLEGDYIKIRSVSLETEIGGGYQIFLDYKFEDGTWKLNSYNPISSVYKPFNLTKEEAEVAYVDYSQGLQFIKETYMEVAGDLVKVYLFYAPGDYYDSVIAVNEDSGYAQTNIPPEIVPLEWRSKLFEYY